MSYYSVLRYGVVLPVGEDLTGLRHKQRSQKLFDWGLVGGGKEEIVVWMLS